MIYLYTSAALFGVYYLRKFWLAPWARYVRHSIATSKQGQHVFLTVKRVRWYPPFLEYEETWHSNSFAYGGDRIWGREHDGADDGRKSVFAIERSSPLSAILLAAIGREAELEELAE